MKFPAALFLLIGFWSVGTCAETNRPASDAPEINLPAARLNLVLDLYAEASGRTLLLHPLLPAMTITLRAKATNNAQCAKVLAAAFATNGIAVIADGGKFALVVPKSYVSSVHANSAEIKPTPDDAEAGNTIPAGSVVFINMEFAQVAVFYADWRGRKANFSDWRMPSPLISFKNQTALTKSELIYALDTLFEWNGVELVPDGDKFLKPVPLAPK
jgi:hypothetical protein